MQLRKRLITFTLIQQQLFKKLSIMKTNITNIQIVEATEFNELAIIISLDKQPTLSEQNFLFSINQDAVVLEF